MVLLFHSSHLNFSLFLLKLAPENINELLLFEMVCLKEVGRSMVTATYNLEADSPIIVFTYDILMELQNSILNNYSHFTETNNIVSGKDVERKV